MGTGCTPCCGDMGQASHVVFIRIVVRTNQEFTESHTVHLTNLMINNMEYAPNLEYHCSVETQCDNTIISSHTHSTQNISESVLRHTKRGTGEYKEGLGCLHMRYSLAYLGWLANARFHL
jgi:hypothetical protein